ncbi:molecular chaperone TorD family protein [Adlercreutzia sp. R21]|uniref:TorD/DmsD family molecular chaperone n=1 Tax=Adlercreutzia wanghongyangiae TaxID=3111451 RepID=UPI002DBF59E5|nr:molecular chaperone TorD family protein [Adlercreutzia sp. R21]MEC4184543.1 molecular chaperone TorD family protein [Adlercreutzia sp. R21]
MGYSREVAADDTRDAVAELLALRQLLYALTARVFAAEPDEELATWCATDEVGAALAFLAEAMADAGGEVELVDGTTIAAAAASGVGDGALAAEYMKLFVGPATPLAPPWESVYRSADGLLFQASTLAVRDAYRAAGFAAAGYPHEPDDHLGTELGFMAALGERALRAWQVGDISRALDDMQHQAAFLEEHLSLWASALRDRVMAARVAGSAGPFYAASADIACALVACDDAMINELMAEMERHLGAAE